MLTTTSYDLDLATVERARGGDDRAFSQLVEAYQRPIYNLCYRLLGNPHDAEEAAQETFLRGYTRLNSYDPRGRSKPGSSRSPTTTALIAYAGAG